MILCYFFLLYFSQSVNILKQDHEDALSRLKKLKEQEIEAILSTQVHTKYKLINISFNYLNKMHAIYMN